MDSRIAPYICQVRSHGALERLIARGAGARLPQLDWTIAANTGLLIGDVPLGIATGELRRATFNAWANLVGATERKGALDWVARFAVQEESQPVEAMIRMVVLTVGADA